MLQHCDELEAAQIEHKASEHHEVIDAFRLWLKELIEMGGDNMKDFVGNGLLVNVMYKVSLSDDKELDVQKLMYVLSAKAEFIPSTRGYISTAIDGSTQPLFHCHTHQTFKLTC